MNRHLNSPKLGVSRGPILITRLTYFEGSTTQKYKHYRPYRAEIPGCTAQRIARWISNIPNKHDRALRNRVEVLGSRRARLGATP